MKQENAEKIILPDAFATRMREQLGGEYDAFAASFDKPLAGALRISRRYCEEKLAARTGWALSKVPWSLDGYYYNEADHPGRHPLHEAGAYYMQEPSAMSVAAAADVQPGMRVLDLCAAPGGKSCALADALAGSGLLVANEIIPKRAAILSQNVERMGLANTVVTNETPERIAGRFPEFFNRVVVDAPCSGEGMFKKEPDALSMWSPETVAMCAARQKEILEQAAACVAPGGKLIYSTCTFAREEDEDNIKWFLANHEEYSLISEEKLLPHKIEGGGHYVAVLQKAGEAAQAPANGKLMSNRAQAEEWKRFAAEYMPGYIYDKNLLLSFGDHLYLMPEAINLDGLKVTRPGLELGAMDHDRFMPAYALAHALLPGEFSQEEELSDEQAAAYIRGEVLPCSAGFSGYTLLRIDGVGLAFGKTSGGQIKNHYPKGLRRGIIIS